MPIIVINLNKFALKNLVNFYNSKMKKIIYISFFILIFGLFITNSLFACDALRVSIGSEVSKVEDTLDFISDQSESSDEEDLATHRFSANTNDYCPDLGLENTKLYAFVYKSQLVGLRVETWEPNKDINKIYEFVKSNYGNIDSEPANKNWRGYKEINQGGELILYSKYEISDEIYESLDISNEKFIDQTYGENIIVLE